jgi:pyruvate dehydrogenase E1 component alpha subunit
MRRVVAAVQAGGVPRDGAIALDELYASMVRMRLFEEAVARLWARGLISGELHLGIGEEGVVAGVVGHLRDGDALAVDHRSTPPLVGRGVDLAALVLELLGSPDGLCRGQGGHMHLFAPERLAASSGIVGAAAPVAAGFALAAEHLRPGAVAVGFFGEGAMNQGMVLEAMNLAAAWRLPVVLVCKDSRYAITTGSAGVTAGSLATRARGLGLPVHRVDGSRADRVARVAAHAVQRARRRRGPSLVIARCHHREGHFLGDPLLQMLTDPLGSESRGIVAELAAAARSRPGAAPGGRIAGLMTVGRSLAGFAVDRALARDPLAVTGRRLPPAVRRSCEQAAAREVGEAVARACDLMEVAA